MRLIGKKKDGKEVLKKVYIPWYDTHIIRNSSRASKTARACSCIYSLSTRSANIHFIETVKMVKTNFIDPYN